MSEVDGIANKSLDLVQQLKDDNLANLRMELLAMHIYDQSRFYLSLNAEERQKIIASLSPKEMADMFDVLEEDQEQISSYLAEMPPKYAATMLSEMYTDNAVAILKQLSKTEKAHYFSLMSVLNVQEIKELLDYQAETAGAIMTTEYVSVESDWSLSQALTVVKQAAKEAETIYYVYVLQADGRLVGVLSLRDLIIQPETSRVADIMSEQVISVKVEDEQTTVAQTIKNYDFLAIPVVDNDQKILGIITVDDVLDVLDEEAVSDYSGLAGVDVDEASENPFKAASKRLPWLITLLFLGMSTASLISHYEDLVSEASILAVFISLITGTAGNAGTQSLAVAVRRLAMQTTQSFNFFRLMFSEIATGLVTGAVTGGTIWLLVGFWKGNFMLGFVIGIAMLCAITIANLAGSLIPMVMDRLGFDPAVASGPFITTLSDLTSVLIYFNIASLFMRFFIH